MKDKKAADESFGITSDDLYHKLKTTDSLLLLDLRDKSEYESRHIQGDVLVSSYHKTDLGMLPNVAKTDKELVLVCLDGSQSSQYAKMLFLVILLAEWITGITACIIHHTRWQKNSHR